MPDRHRTDRTVPKSLRWSMQPFQEYFRTGIIRRMNEQQVTIHELAKVLDSVVSRRTLFKFLAGGENVTLRVLAVVLGVLDLDVAIETRSHLGPYRRLKEMPHWRDAVIAYDQRQRARRRRKGK